MRVYVIDLAKTDRINVRELTDDKFKALAKSYTLSEFQAAVNNEELFLDNSYIRFIDETPNTYLVTAGVAIESVTNIENDDESFYTDNYDVNLGVTTADTPEEALTKIAKRNYGKSQDFKVYKIIGEPTKIDETYFYQYKVDKDSITIPAADIITEIAYEFFYIHNNMPSDERVNTIFIDVKEYTGTVEDLIEKLDDLDAPKVTFINTTPEFDLELKRFEIAKAV